MFKGLTQRAQRVLTVLAQEEAKRFHSDQLQPEHIVLALLKDGDGVAVKALQRVKVDIAEMQLEIERSIPKKSGGLILGDVPDFEPRQADPRGLGRRGAQSGPRVHRHRAPPAGRGQGDRQRHGALPGALQHHRGGAARRHHPHHRARPLPRPGAGQEAPRGAAPDAADSGQGDADARRVLPRPHLLRPRGQARSGHRPGQGDPARHPDPGAPHQEQPGAHRRAGRRQDRHRRGPRPADRRRHGAGDAHRQARPDPRPRVARGGHQVPRRVRGAPQAGA